MFKILYLITKKNTKISMSTKERKKDEKIQKTKTKLLFCAKFLTLKKRIFDIELNFIFFSIQFS